MKKVENGFMGRLLEVGLLGISIPLGQRKVRFESLFLACLFLSKVCVVGWAPTTFVSSRNERAKKHATRPEDFMDEEDLQDVKDSRKIVDETEQMDFHSGGPREGLGEGNDDFKKEWVTVVGFLSGKLISWITVLLHEHSNQRSFHRLKILLVLKSSKRWAGALGKESVPEFL